MARFKKTPIPLFPESKGGPTIIENLVTSCKPCNHKKRARVGIWPKPIGHFSKTWHDKKEVFMRNLTAILILEGLCLAVIPYFFYQAVMTHDETMEQAFIMALFLAGGFGISAWIMSTQLTK